MAKKRRKVYRKTKTGWKELSPYLRRKAERERQERTKPKPKLYKIPEDKLRPMIREAARAGLVEAIEHSHNFWSVGEGYKRYINLQIEDRASALLAAVRMMLRDEFTKLRVVNLRARKRR